MHECSPGNLNTAFPNTGGTDSCHLLVKNLKTGSKQRHGGIVGVVGGGGCTIYYLYIYIYMYASFAGTHSCLARTLVTAKDALGSSCFNVFAPGRL